MNLREIRGQLGISQSKLSELVGVTQPTISAWERGTGEPSLSKIKKLLNILNCSTDELLGSEIYRPSSPKAKPNGRSHKEFINNYRR